MQNTTETNSGNKTFAKLIVGAVVFLILVMIVFSAVRSVSIIDGGLSDDPFESRYLDHPIVSGLHMLFSMCFLLLAPLQFNAKLRTRRRDLHRLLGRFLVLCAVLSGLYGLLSAIYLPVFGGLSSETATWFFGPIFLICVTIGLLRARHGKYAQHREWMIRTFALGLGVATQRILIVLFSIFGYSFYDSFGVALWIGFSVNLIIAEIWINLTRRAIPKNAKQ